MNRFLFFLLLFFTACEATPPADMTDPGQLLYFGYAKKDVNCSKCHGPEGKGGSQAPDMRRTFSKYSDQKIMDFILHGKGLGLDSMPAFEEKLTATDLQNLMLFIKSLQIDSTATQ